MQTHRLTPKHSRCVTPIVWLLAASVTSVHAQTAPSTPNLDAVELFSGQTFHGTLTDQSLTIRSRLGTISAPVNSLLSLVCQPSPHILETITTRDGDELVGRIDADSIHFQPADGPALEIPLAQISKVSVGLSSDNPGSPATAPSATAAIVSGLRGDHLAVNLPASIDFRTRWGLLTLRPDQIRQIVFCSKDQAAHRLTLTDGSVLAGLVTAQTLSLRPRNVQGPPLDVPVGEMARLDSDSTASPAPGPRLEMIGGDILRAAPQGTLTLQTGFSQIQLADDDIQTLRPVPDSPGDLAVTLSDGRALRGAPQETSLDCRLDCGVTLSAPVEMIADYSKFAPATPLETTREPAAAPGPQRLQATVEQLVGQLADDDASVRRQAQDQLTALGPAAIRPLQQIRPNQMPGVKFQINAVITRIRANGD